MTIPAELTDLITGVLSFTFTLLILSYIIGDNPLFRAGVYIFVGASAGYIASIAMWQVIWVRLAMPLTSASTPPIEKALLAAPLIMTALILMKVSPRLAGMASFAMAFMVGVGAAVTIVGAVSGTLMPQVAGTINAFAISSTDPAYVAEALVSGVIVLLGAVFSLAYFHFGARVNKKDGAVRRLGLFEVMAWVGRIFIGITLGAVFAGVFSAALTAFIERIHSLILFVGSFL
jgi:hypothetical protein